jgi:hypothetical protein
LEGGVGVGGGGLTRSVCRPRIGMRLWVMDTLRHRHRHAVFNVNSGSGVSVQVHVQCVPHLQRPYAILHSRGLEPYDAREVRSRHESAFEP